MLALARELAKGKGESHWRGAIGRAYYASFHALTAWHATMPMPGAPGVAKGEHEQLIQRLCHPAKECSSEQRRRSLWFSGQLASLRAMRIVADYRLADTVTLEEAVSACALAAMLLDKL